jgi:hypothetical protein
MAIYRLLREATFDQHQITRMVAAYEAALELLKLNDRSDSVTELIALKIIELERNGVTDAAHLCAQAIKESGLPLPN